MLCSVSFRISFPLSGLYDRAHRSAAPTFTLTKLPRADLRPSTDFHDLLALVISAHAKISSGVFSSLQTATNVLGTVPDGCMIYDAFAYRSWNRTPPIDDRDRPCFVMERPFLGTTEITSWIERG